MVLRQWEWCCSNGNGVAAIGMELQHKKIMLQEQENGVAATGNGVAATGNGVAATGNGVAETGNGVAATGNGVAATGNGVAATEMFPMILLRFLFPAVFQS